MQMDTSIATGLTGCRQEDLPLRNRDPSHPGARAVLTDTATFPAKGAELHPLLDGSHDPNLQS